MRPSITGGLEQAVDDVHEKAGFDDPGEFVRYATRLYVDEVRRQNE